MTLSGQNDITLEREAQYLHDHFFSEKIHREVLSRYVEANRRCLPYVDTQSAGMIDKIVSCELDVEAIEFVLRLKKRDNFLTRKIEILFFLVEVRSQYFGYFFNCKEDMLSAIRSLIISIMTTPYKYVKGKYLSWKYKLV